MILVHTRAGNEDSVSGSRCSSVHRSGLQQQLTYLSTDAPNILAEKTSRMSTTLMIQGTTSDAGKTTLVAGLCRVFARRGMQVVPFKPQNMALNSAVTEDGGEIGRSQALQALASGVQPHTDMNPILLKPNSDTGAQVIIQGQARTNMEARAYQEFKSKALDYVLQSYRRLCHRAELVLVEGAGSPAEINLRENDVANMGFAEAVDCPVILVADIDRGGVFAHLVGTLALLSPSEQDRVAGFVINRFRGDIALLEEGLHWLESRTDKPVLAVLPYLTNLRLDQEDAIDARQSPAEPGGLAIKVPVFPRISNHTDYDALRMHPQVDLTFVGEGESLAGADMVILPGSKSVRADLAWFKKQGFTEQIKRHLRYGGKLLGICGGFQMLGQQVCDPHGIEGPAGAESGLNVLDMQTRLAPGKKLELVEGTLCIGVGAAVKGYEIHCGSSQGSALDRPFIQFECGPEGALSADGLIAGTYVHGLFDCPDALGGVLEWAGLKQAKKIDRAQVREAELDRLADAIEQHMDWQKFVAAAGFRANLQPGGMTQDGVAS